MTNQMSPEIFRLNAEVEERHWWFVGRRRIAEGIVRNLIRPVPGSLVADVGCGTGANIASLADSYKCVGIDPSPDAISLARERFPKVEFICGRAPEDLKERTQSVGLFLLMDVLEHVADDKEFLSGLVRAGSSEAQYLITVPADMRLWSEHDVSHGHYRRYNRAELESTLRGANLEVRLLSYFNSRLYPPIRLIRALGRRRKRALGRSGTDLARTPTALNALLRWLYAGEYRALKKVFDSPQESAYPFGVSLIAVARRAASAINAPAREV